MTGKQERLISTLWAQNKIKNLTLNTYFYTTFVFLHSTEKEKNGE